MPCGDPQAVVEGPITDAGRLSSSSGALGRGHHPKLPKTTIFGFVWADATSQTPEAECWELAAPSLPGVSPHQVLHCPGLLHALEERREERKTPTKVPLKLIVFIAGLTMSCKSFYDPAQEHQWGLNWSWSRMSKGAGTGESQNPLVELLRLEKPSKNIKSRSALPSSPLNCVPKCHIHTFSEQFQGQ